MNNKSNRDLHVYVGVFQILSLVYPHNSLLISVICIGIMSNFPVILIPFQSNYISNAFLMSHTCKSIPIHQICTKLSTTNEVYCNETVFLNGM